MKLDDYKRAHLEKMRGRVPDGPPPDPPPSNLVELCKEFSAEVTRALHELLETKHLYQRVKVSYDNIHGVNKDAPMFRVIAELTWEPLGERSRLGWQDAEDIRELHFRVPHVKLYCATCDSLEVFNPVGEDSPMHGSAWRLRAVQLTEPRTVQAFAFSFLCQACKEVPETLLVRREGLSLILCGRSPIETVSVPPVVPKDFRKFYSGAVLAYQSGQALAGNFMLRTLIEQFARAVTAAASEDSKADEVLDGYMATLPPDFKNRFRSMKDLYGKLSADIHGAVGDPALFDDAQAAILKHFTARQLYEL